MNLKKIEILIFVLKTHTTVVLDFGVENESYNNQYFE